MHVVFILTVVNVNFWEELRKKHKLRNAFFQTGVRSVNHVQIILAGIFWRGVHILCRNRMIFLLSRDGDNHVEEEASFLFQVPSADQKAVDFEIKKI